MTQAPPFRQPPRRSTVLSSHFFETFISTAAVQRHRTAKRSAPRTSPLLWHLCHLFLAAAAWLLTCLPAAAATTPQPAPAAVTDAIARAFIAARSAAGLRPLTRIPDRPILRRIVCSAAANNSPVGHNEGNATFISRESQADSALVPVTDLDHLPAAIKRVAEYDDRATARGRRIHRFSVAAFTTPADPSVTWVGVALYWSRLTEYVALHLSRTYTPPDLRFDLVPVCLSVR